MENVLARGLDYAIVVVGGVEIDHTDAALCGVGFVVEKLRIEFDEGQLLEDGFVKAHRPARVAVGVGKEDTRAEQVDEDAGDAHQGEEQEDEEDGLADHEREG